MDPEASQNATVTNDELTSYPFLNHSPTTLNNDLPPDVDNKPLARQRRKRTSPEDQAVLEAAYQNDPKPDKAARLRLVEQIALGEKEVQIWFQNRRQTSRRRSRPLLPHEIAQFHMSRYGTDLSSDDQLDSSFSQDDVWSSSPADPVKQSSSLPSENPDEANKPTVIRRSMPSLQQILAETTTPSSSQDEPLSITGKPSRKASSFVRLSMTGGNAQVTTKDGFTPSPPRPEQVMLSETAEKPAEPVSSLKRSLSGRSKDSRAWEFWCDKECRTELVDHAEKAGKGSAADAIGAIRATNTRKALLPLPAKNSFANRLAPSRRTVDGKRPMLQRAHTSNGRLQHSMSTNEQGKRVKLAKPTVFESDTSTYIPGNESDKENWTPGDPAMPAGLKKATSVPQKHERRPGKGRDAENDPEADEVNRFMRGGRSSSNVSGTEELDCVQGLLSLSQGHWAR